MIQDNFNQSKNQNKSEYEMPLDNQIDDAEYFIRSEEDSKVVMPGSQATIDKKSTPAKPKPINTNVDESRNNNQLDSKTYKESQIMSKFYGINDQDIDYKSNNAFSNQETNNKTGS